MLDLREIVHRLGGDVAFAVECADLFEQEVPGMLGSLREAFASGSSEALRQAAHALKGSAANFSVHGASATAAEIERTAREGRLDAVPALLDGLEQDLARLVTELQGLKGLHDEEQTGA